MIIKHDNTTERVGMLPEGVRIQSWNAWGDEFGNYKLTMAIEKADELIGSFICDAATLNAQPQIAKCPVITGITIILN